MSTPNGPIFARRSPFEKRQVIGAAVVLALVTVFVMSDWFLLDRMPGGDFPGYVASLDQTRNWLAESGRVPRWCPQCYGGASVFTSRLKEVLASPLVWMSEPVIATKLAFAVFRWLGAFGIFACFVRLFSAPYAGVAAGIVYSFGSYSNHEIEHLEVAFAAMLMPVFLLAAHETMRGKGRAAPIVLGILAAATFSNTWIQAIVSLVLSGLLLWLRPWADGCRMTSQQPWRRLALAGVIAILLSASSLAWMTADASNHRLISPEIAAKQREFWSIRSPVVLVNREGVLADWLIAQLPPGPRIASFGSGSNYLGIGAIAISIGGWFFIRRRRRERRWVQLAGLLLLLQFNLASGPYVVLDQLGWSTTGVASVQLAILFVALGLGVTLFYLSRRMESRGNLIEGAVALLILIVLISVPLYEGLVLLLPPLRAHHSPGHFAALMPFPLAMLFGLGLRALCRIPSARSIQAVVGIGLCALVYVDYAPSIRNFSKGRPLAPLRATARVIESLEREDPTLRIAQTRSYSPIASYLIENAGLGFAWGWLPWQAGPAWSDYIERSVWNRDALEPARQQTLLAMGRIRYFFLAPGSDRFSPKVMPAPWTLRERSGEFEIWEQSEIRPYAVFYPGPPSGPRPDWIRDIGTTSAPVWTRPVPEKIDITLPTEHSSGWLFLSESHHPWWRANVDGKDAELIRADPAFIAVPVDANDRNVSVTFEPPLFVAIADRISVLAASLISFLGLIWMIRAGRQRQQRRNQASDRPLESDS